MKTSFYLRDVHADGETPIMASVHYGKHRIRFSIGVSIAPDRWNSKTEKARRGIIHEHLINARISQLRATISSLYVELTANTPNLPPDTFRAAIDKATNKQVEPESTDSNSINLLDALKQTSLGNDSRQLTTATRKIYATLRKHLQAYQRRFRTTLTWDNVTTKFFQQFFAFLIASPTPNEPERGIGLNNVSAWKNIQTLRAFLKYAADVEERPMCYDFRKFTKRSMPKGEVSRKTYLTTEELERLRNFDLEGDTYLERIRDLFLFLAYTGIRYEDAQKFDSTNLRDDVWVYHTAKNRKEVHIPVLPVARAIWDKYNGRLPQLTNQYFNRELKTICEKAGFNEMIRSIDYHGIERSEYVSPKWESITAHTAKRSFVTNLINAGVPVEVVCEITGNTLQSISRYIVPTSNDTKRIVLAAVQKSIA